MEIRSVRAIPLRADLSAPFKFADIVRTRSANVVVRIETDDALVGWGEACPVPQLTAETQRSIVDVVSERVAPLLAGQDPLRRNALTAAVMRSSHQIDFTMTAIDTALLDLAGKFAGVSVSELFGGRQGDRVEVHGSVGWDEDPERVADVAEQAAERFDWLKLYAGKGTLEDDLLRVETARERVGEDHPFLLDINGMWSVTEVTRAAPRLREAGVRLVEQPVAPHDHRGNAAATRTLVDQYGIDVAADESVRSPHDVFAVAAAGAASVVNVGVSKLGGMTRALRTATVAQSCGLGVMVGSVVELGLATGAGLHLAAVLPDLAYPSYLGGYTKYQRQITLPAFELRDSRLTVPSTPGLGVEVDDRAIEEMRLR